jgi:hypothetical protein
MDEITQTQTEICAICDEIKELLLTKNRKYGDSALNPVRVFSKASPLEQLKVRIDDKLSRLKNAQDDEDEDVVTDLIGYLVLYKVAESRNTLQTKTIAEEILCNLLGPK